MILDESSTLANAIYIYLVILFAGILIGSLLALFKEFLSSDRANMDLEKDFDSTDTEESKSFTSAANGDTSQSHDKLEPTKGCLARFKSKKSTISRSTKKTGSFPSAEQSEGAASKNSPVDVHAEDVPRSVARERKCIRYSMKELIELQSSVTRLNETGGKVKLSTLLRPHMPIPIPSIWPEPAVKRALDEIRTHATQPCAATSHIALFRLVCLSVSKTPFSNSLHFRRDFCELMTFLIDSLTIYSGTGTQPLLQLSLVDVATCLLWEHWNSKWCGVVEPVDESRWSRSRASSIAAKANHSDPDYINDSYEQNYTDMATSMLKDLEPTAIMPDGVIFRLLCNLYLGTPAIAKSVRSHSIYKLSAVFHACATRTQCGQHGELIALLAQAVSSAERDSLKAFFYELFIDLLEPHVYCCLEHEDVVASESPIYELIFRGLWTDQAPQVRQKALKVVSLLGERFADVKTWMKYMKQASTTSDQGLGHVGAPGSWSVYNGD